MNLKKIINAQESGFILIVVLLMASFLIVLASGLASVGIYQDRLFNQETAKHEAIHMAEAGVNYYRWHLAHNQTDFFDGTGADPGGNGAPFGPYVHNYTALSTNNTGHFSLLITPPPTGSTIVTINSTGWLDSFPNTKRTVEVKYGIPSLAHFSFLTNDSAWFGNTEHVVGEMHSNGGIRMDGTNDSVIKSARQTFDCPSGFGCNFQSTCSSPCTWKAASSTCTCPGIFGAGPNPSLWTYPVSAIPFSTISIDLNNIKNNTLTGYTFNTNGSNKGWHITFKNNGHFDARLVSAVNNGLSQLADDWNITQATCQGQSCNWLSGNCFCSVAETIKTEGAATDHVIPANGLIFVNDGDAWVDGIVNGRVTLGAGTFPDNANKRRSIFINGNLQYLARDGNNSLGLIAQKDIKIPRDTPPCNITNSKLTVDAILLAQNGRVFRNYYSSHTKCFSIEIYGGIITNQTWTWSWDSPVTDGYINTNSIYDPNVTYSPPPSFPTSGEYTFISWEEK